MAREAIQEKEGVFQLYFTGCSGDITVGKYNDATPAVMAALRMGIVMAAVLTPVQIFTGDLHGLNTLEHQPAKVAAMEALWETQRGAPLVLFGLPDAETQSNRFALELPGIASLILVHDIEGEVKGIS